MARRDDLRNAREKSLSGRSPTAAGRDKTKQALDWVYRWDWAAASTLDSLSGAQRRGLSARLIKHGLLKATRTECGCAVKGVPQAILTLTKLGVTEIERWREALLPYDLDPYRVRQDKIRHDQLAQSATAAALSAGRISSFSTEKELAEKSLNGLKQPDVVWQLPNGQRMGIEVELSAKWERDLDQFVLSCLKAIEKGADGRARLDMIAIVTDSPAIAKRYKAAFEPGATVGLWAKDARGRWSKNNKIKVSDWVKDKMQWRLIAD